MHSMLNAQMIQASQADRSRDERMATHRRELREGERSAPHHARQLKRLAAVTAGLVLIGGASDALAASSAHFAAGTRASAGRVSHARHTAATDMRFHFRY
ncbi:MAG TPA: hypothetical protein VMP89_20040 [Solirubrobacteraceae bacterium]|nr:hypothetical protein [Solirubrobacteraceae bacterium]